MSECTELTVTTDLLEMSVANGEGTTLNAAQLAMSVTKEEDGAATAASDVGQTETLETITTLTVQAEALGISVENGEGATLAGTPLSSALVKEANTTGIAANGVAQVADCVDELPGAYSNGYSAGYTTGTGP